MFDSGVTGVSSTSPMDLLSPITHAKASSSTSTSTRTTSLGGNDTSSTFLNLLVKELQNQDPTAPVDSTAMVGQMISLNSLDQLISINQTLTSGASSSTTSTATTGASSQALVAAKNALLSGPYNPTSADAATSAASDPTTPLNLNNLSTLYGGK